MRNVEIKARVQDLDGLINKAKLVSGSSGEIIKQNDVFYKVPEGRFKIRRFESGDAEMIFYERPDSEGPKLCSYQKIALPKESVETFQRLFTQALTVKVAVQKTRHLYLVGQTRIHIDCVEHLGNFMELEVVLKDDQTTDDGQAIANKLMEELDIQKEDLISCAYADMLLKN